MCIFACTGGDLSIVSVRESTGGHETEQTPVATGFQTHVFESKLDILTNSMLIMSDTLQRLAQPHMALVTPEEEGALLAEGERRCLQTCE